MDYKELSGWILTIHVSRKVLTDVLMNCVMNCKLHKIVGNIVIG